MTAGLRVWAPSGQLRVDTSDRTLRLTDSIYVASRRLGGNAVQSALIAIPGFDPSKDGAFLSGAEAGYLGYDAAEVEDGFLPSFSPVVGGVNVTWRGYGGEYSRTIRYMAFYVKVLRAG